MTSQDFASYQAVILFADVVNYSGLIASDVRGTRTRLNRHWREFLEPTIVGHRGRRISFKADEILATFGSVVDALRCAIAVQRGMAERNAVTPPDRQILFRIGINSGEVIVDGDDVHADGVNIAKRLEGLAAPGGICVSGRVRDDAASEHDITFEDAGERRLKNIPGNVRVVHVRFGGAPTCSPRTPSV